MLKKEEISKVFNMLGLDNDCKRQKISSIGSIHTKNENIIITYLKVDNVTKSSIMEKSTYAELE